jgi:acyl carrier protein
MMTIQEFIAAYADLYDETDPSEFAEDTNYQDLEQWSSLTGMMIITMVKNKMGKTLTGPEVRKCETIEELYQLIQSK